MRILLFLLSAPVMAGDFAVFAEEGSEQGTQGLGLEFSVGQDWKLALMVSQFENYRALDSYYAGLGVSKSLWSGYGWQFEAGVNALRVDQAEYSRTYQPPPFIQNGDHVMPIYLVTVEEDFDHDTLAPHLTLNYGVLGVRLMSMEHIEDQRGTVLQVRLTF